MDQSLAFVFVRREVKGLVGARGSERERLR